MKNERWSFRRSRSLSHRRTPLRPRIMRNETYSIRSSTRCSSQRYHTTEGAGFHSERHLNGRCLPPPVRQRDGLKNLLGNQKKSKFYNDAPRSAHRAGIEIEMKSLSVMISEERENASSRGLPSSATRAAVRNRAIQQKRREIEEVYKQDCDTIGIVVKMLIDKDPSLERLIQASLQENLREIGLRCVEAMERFIRDYDSQDSCTATSHRD